MDRREFLKQGVAVSTSAALSSLPASAAPNSRKKPNVLYVFSDQHRAQSMPGEPLCEVVAPALDRFRKENLSMDACISNYPLCVPHRAILMSGRYSWQTKVYHNEHTLEPEVPGLGDVFQRAGYNTGYVGKWHLYHGEGVFVPKGPYRFGFEYWRVWANTNKHHDGVMFDAETGEKVTVPGYQPTRMTDEALEFINAQKGVEKPWLLVLSWNPPHPPFDPPQEERSLYDAPTLNMAPNVRLSTPADKITNPYPQLASMETLHRAEQGYYGGITAVDKEFARLLKVLDDNGMAEDTIVVYTSDHGEMMGSHGHMAKQMPHEESCRVPFYVRVPGGARGGRSSNSLFSSVDIYPTLCGLAGITAPEHCSGHDFSSFIREGKNPPKTEMVFLMNEQGPVTREEVNVQAYRGVRTSTHTYAIQPDGRWCLYDNRKDPHQMNNLIKDPSQQALVRKLEAALMAWSKATGDPFPYETATASYSSYPSA